MSAQPTQVHDFAPSRITQENIRDLRDLRRQKKDLEVRIKSIEKGYIEQLQDGMSVEHGDFRMAVKVTKRRTVAWKKELERIAGADTVKTLQENAEPKEYTSLEIE